MRRGAGFFTYFATGERDINVKVRVWVKRKRVVRLEARGARSEEAGEE